MPKYTYTEGLSEDTVRTQRALAVTRSFKSHFRTEAERADVGSSAVIYKEIHAVLAFACRLTVCAQMNEPNFRTLARER